MIKRNEKYNLEVTGEQLFIIMLLVGRSNGRVADKDAMYLNIKSMFKENFILNASDCLAVLHPLLPTIGLVDVMFDVKAAMDKIFHDPEEEARKKHKELAAKAKRLEEELGIVKVQLKSLKTGWIDWEGGNCPVPGSTIIGVKLRNGRTLTGMAEVFTWYHVGDSDIIAYRVGGE